MKRHAQSLRLGRCTPECDREPSRNSTALLVGFTSRHPEGDAQHHDQDDGDHEQAVQEAAGAFGRAAVGLRTRLGTMTTWH